MQIPELPTDNLYKFMATFGFVIAVLCFGYLAVQTTAQTMSIAKLGVASDAYARVAEYEAEFIQRRTEALTQISQSLRTRTDEVLSRTEADATSLSASDLDAIEMETSALQTELESLRQQFHEYSIQQTDRASPIQQELAALDAELGIWRWLGLVLLAGGAAGTLMSFHGFRLWYKNVQIHQDAILEEQALSAAKVARSTG